MKCHYPDCDGGAAGTICKPKCKPERICCDGECRQGRKCPLYDPIQDDMPEAVGRAVLLVGILALLAVVAALVT